MITENINKIREQIEKSCHSVGRKIEDITLIAVSKTRSIDDISEAYAHGIRVFGENYVQEAIEKIPELKKRYPDISFHFIGHLQSNKAKVIYDHVSCIQTLDSLKLARLLDAQGAERQSTRDVLIQVNTSRESQKSGIQPEEVDDFLFQLNELRWIKVRGLMTIGSFSDDMTTKIREFQVLKNLVDSLYGKGYSDMREVSMGMSDDFDLAIKEGATIIRVGTNIFGKRA